MSVRQSRRSSWSRGSRPGGLDLLEEFDLEIRPLDTFETTDLRDR